MALRLAGALSAMRFHKHLLLWSSLGTLAILGYAAFAENYLGDWRRTQTSARSRLPAGQAGLLVDREDGDTVMAPVRGVNVIAGGVDLDFRARVLSLESFRPGGNALPHGEMALFRSM